MSRNRTANLSGNLIATSINASNIILASGIDLPAQSNAAYVQANNAFDAANNRVLKAGDTMTGELNVANNLLVTGNVGIGTDNPGFALQIGTADSNANNMLVLAGGLGKAISLTSGAIYSEYTGVGTGAFTTLLGGQGFKFKDYNNNNDWLIIDANTVNVTNNLVVTGNVGIGTTNAVNRLTVSDTTSAKIRLNGGNNQNGILLDGLSNASTYYLGNGSGLMGPDFGFVILDIENNRPVFFVNQDIGELRTSAPTFQTVYTAGIERLRVDSSGSVVIGTTNTAYKFHVLNPSNGFIARFTGGASSDVNVSIFGTTSSSFGSIGTESNHPLNIFTNGIDRVSILTNGNVGVGTTNPLSKLHVAGGTSDALLYLSGRSDSNSEVTIGSVYGRNENSSFDGCRIKFDVAADYGIIGFWTGNSGSLTEKMRITNTGNVCIGTTSPTSKLTISSVTLSQSNSALDINASGSGTYQRGIRVLNSSMGGNDGILVQVGKADNTRNAGQMVFNHVSDASTSNYLEFGLYGVDKVLNIAGTGNVGIGTTSPANKLHVYGSIRAGIAGNSNANYAALEVASSGTGNEQAAIAIQQVTSEGDTIIFADYEPYVEWGISTENNSNLIQFTAGDATNNLGSKTLYNRSGAARTAYTKFQVALEDGTALIGGKVGVGTTNPGNYRLNAVYGAALNVAPAEFSGPGTAAWGIGLVVRTTGGTDGASILFRNRDAKNWQIRGETNGTGFQITEDGGDATYGSGFGTPRLTVAAGGAVSIPGSLSKGSGSFKIDHPLPEKSNTHHLVHSFIEGPQADLIYRGKTQLTDGIATINIDTASGMTEGTFIILCRDIQCFTTNESDWDAVRGSVTGNILTIESQNTNSTATISWMVIGERQDKHMFDTEWTDENGKVIVEPEKPPQANLETSYQ